MVRQRLRTPGMLAAVLVIVGFTMFPASAARHVAYEPNGQGLLCEQEIISFVHGDYPNFTIEEVARLSELAAIGQLTKGEFIKHTASGKEGVCGTPGDPAHLHYLVEFQVEEYVKGIGPDKITLVLAADSVGKSAVVSEDEEELDPGNHYLLLLGSQPNNFDERHLGGPHYYRLKRPKGTWLIQGEDATYYNKYYEDIVFPLAELRDRVVNACQSEILPSDRQAKFFLKYQVCP